jgi:hypothetical protein
LQEEPENEPDGRYAARVWNSVQGVADSGVIPERNDLDYMGVFCVTLEEFEPQVRGGLP